MLTKDDLERERYEPRQKAQRDQLSLLDEATERGLEQGLGKGEWIGQIHLCQQRLNRPLSPTDELLQLSTDELRRQAETLQAELFGS